MDKKGAEFYINGVLKGDRVILSQAITLVESLNEKHQTLAQNIVDGIIHKSGHSFRLGITGVPGVGKSTFIEKFGKELVSHQYKLAVLAIDPSSNISKGSILGDKTRMEELSVHPHVFIRPSPSIGNLGGVTSTTYETILLCEAAGFDFIIIETVGVGQSEVNVSHITDFFLLLMLAGAGDELQGIKRGIMEMADALVITKADGDNIEKAKTARSEYAHAMHLFQASESGWTPRTQICSGLNGTGIKEVFEMIEEYKRFSSHSDYFNQKRKQQQFQLFKNTLEEQLKRHLYSNAEVQQKIMKIEKLNEAQVIQPFKLAREIIHEFVSKNN